MRGKTSPPATRCASGVDASMRPPQNAGENLVFIRDEYLSQERFNEAPAECGGKPATAARRFARGHASMRPPQNAGENGARKRAADVADARLQ